jgi:hypothetical protein
MKTATLVTALSLMWFDGCRVQPANSPEVTAEIAARTAYETVRARRTFSPGPPATDKCCQKCVNGKVRSGDGIAWVPCPCPPTCKCKCKDGSCQKTK